MEPLVPRLAPLEFCLLEGSDFTAGNMMEEAGELPGVSTAVMLEIDRSIDKTVEIESRSSEFWLAFTSTSAESIAVIAAVRFLALADMSW